MIPKPGGDAPDDDEDARRTKREIDEAGRDGTTARAADHDVATDLNDDDGDIQDIDTVVDDP